MPQLPAAAAGPSLPQVSSRSTKQPGVSAAKDATGPFQDVVNQIVKEYEERITELACLTADLPKRLSSVMDEMRSVISHDVDTSELDVPEAQQQIDFKKRFERIKPVHLQGDKMAMAEPTLLASPVGKDKKNVGHVAFDAKNESSTQPVEEDDKGRVDSLPLGGSQQTCASANRSKDSASASISAVHLMRRSALDARSEWQADVTPRLANQRTLSAQVPVQAQEHRSFPAFLWTSTDAGDFSHVEEVEGCMHHFVGSPGSIWRIIWEVCGVVFVLYDLIAVPLTLAFQPPATPFTDTLAWVVLLFWSLNVPVSLTTGVISNGILNRNPSLIFKKYCQLWLPVDVVTLVPDWAFMILQLTSDEDSKVGRYTRLTRTVRLIRLARLLRLSKLKTVWTMFYDSIDSEKVGIVADILKMVCLLMIVVHYVACGWYAVASLQTGPSWLKAHGFSEENWDRQYVIAYHWSLTQFTPASMHVQPHSVAERFFAIISILCGLVAFAYIVGSITGSLARLRTLDQRKTQLFWLMRRFLRRNHVHMELSVRIKNYVESVWEHQQSHIKLQGVEILNLLSENLKSELAFYMYSPSLNVHPLFKKLETESVITMRRLALSGVSQVSVAPHDIIFVAGESATHMFIVTAGMLEYWRMNPFGQASLPADVQVVEAGKEWIAEPVLWTKEWYYLGNLTSVRSAELMKVDPSTFASIVKVNPVAYNIANEYARRYTFWLQVQRDRDKLSDISNGEDLEETLDALISSSKAGSPVGRNQNAARRTTHRFLATVGASFTRVPGRGRGWSVRPTQQHLLNQRSLSVDLEASCMNLDGCRHQKSKVEAAYLEASTGLTSGGLTSGGLISGGLTSGGLSSVVSTSASIVGRESPLG